MSAATLWVDPLIFPSTKKLYKIYVSRTRWNCVYKINQEINVAIIEPENRTYICRLTQLIVTGSSTLLKQRPTNQTHHLN